jgi:hypothetical protein
MYSYHYNIIRIEPTIDWNVQNMPRSNEIAWSSRFTGCIQNPYDDGRPLDVTLIVAGDAGHRLWVGPRLAFTTWAGGNRNEFSSTRFFHSVLLVENADNVLFSAAQANIPGNQCLPIVIDYRADRFGQSQLQLIWQFSGVKQVIPSQFLKPTRCVVENASTRSCKGFIGQYYSSRTLLGSFASRVDGPIAFSWEPADIMFPGPNNIDLVTKDDSSIIWQGWITPAHDSGVENYVFESFADDSIRVWVDGRVAVDGTGLVGSASSFALDAARTYPVKIMAINSGNTARFSLAWRWGTRAISEIVPAFNMRQTQDCSPVSPVPECSGLFTEVWKDNEQLEGMPSDSFIAPTVNLKWKLATPSNDQSSGAFSTRLAGCIQNPAPSSSPQDVPATLRIISDGGVRMWIREENVLNNWNAPNSDDTRQITFGANKCVPIIIETKGKDRSVQLRWSWTLNTPSGQQYALDDPIPQRLLKPTRCQSYLSSPQGTQLRQCKGLRADYFADGFVPVAPYTIINSQINNIWDDVDPIIDFHRTDNAITRVQNYFLVRWSGYLYPKHTDGTKNYLIRFRGDDRIRVRIGGASNYLIENQDPQGTRTLDGSSPVPLTAGSPVFIEVEYGAWNSREDVAIAWKLDGVDEDYEIIPLHYFQTSTNCDGSLPACPVPACSGMYAEVFNNNNFEGTPIQSSIDMDVFAQGSVIPNAASVRWTTCVRNPDTRNSATNVRFLIDFGQPVQVWLGNEIVWNNLQSSGSIDITVPVSDRCVPMTFAMTNTSGNPSLKIRFMLTTALGVAISPSPIEPALLQSTRCAVDPASSCKGLNGRLWENYFDFSLPVPADSPPAATFTSRMVTFHKIAPKPFILPNAGVSRYVVRYSGYLIPMHASGSATYRIGALVDDNIRMRIRDTKDLVINQWGETPTHESPTFDVVLTVGQPLPIEIDYLDVGGYATINLHWEQLDNNPTRRVGSIPSHYFLASADCPAQL